MHKVKREREKAADIVRDAGGKIIGRTKLQKIAYLLELTGQGAGFDFEYRYYGPYSEALTDAMRAAVAFGLVTEEECTARWGGLYSTFRASKNLNSSTEDRRARFAEEAAAVNSVELELAATAAYLAAVENCSTPWDETKRLKPEKATQERLERAKSAYRRLLNIKTPKPLPKIA